MIVAGNHDSAARLEAPLPLLQAMRTEVRGWYVKLEVGAVDYDHLCVELKNRQEKLNYFLYGGSFLRQGDYPVVQTEGNPYSEGFVNFIRSFCEKLWKRRKPNQVGSCHRSSASYRFGDLQKRIIVNAQ